MSADPLDGATLHVATNVLDHLDTMYPAALQAVPSSARVSLRNTIRSQVRQAILEDRKHQQVERPIPLTRQQQRTLDFIKGYIAENEVSPSYDEIMAALGLQSKSGVYRLVRGLQNRKRVRFTPNVSRSIEVLS